MTTRSESVYLLDNALPAALDRFRALADLFNDITFDRLGSTGIGSGWRCWEVGAGGPTIPHWMAARVGPSGQVIASDINPSWLGRNGSSDTIQVIRHDVVDEPPPARSLDLVHARLVLIHLPGRDQALANMIESLRPGGWLVIEDLDPGLGLGACFDPTTEHEHRANTVRQAFLDLLVSRGADLCFGRKLPRLFREAGLVDITGEAVAPLCHPAANYLDQVNVDQLREPLVRDCGLSPEDLDRHVEALRSNEIMVSTAPLFSVSGRRPDTEAGILLD
jgi:SAM-dependent methyltransferase